MTRVVCPRCGFVQDNKVECGRCGIIFERYREWTRAAHEPSRGAGSGRGIWKAARWIGAAMAVVAVILVLWDSSPPESATNPEAIKSAQVKIIEHQRKIDARKPHALVLDQAEVNGWLATHLVFSHEESNPPGSEVAAAASEFDREMTQVRSNVRDVKVELLDDSLRARVLFNLYGMGLTLVLQGRLGADGGYLRFEPESGRMGMLPLPQATLRSAVRRLVESPQNREKFRLPPEIRDIGVRQGKLVVSTR
jgi:hypothetical protein